MSEAYDKARERWHMRWREAVLFGLAEGFRRATLLVDLWWLTRTIGGLAGWLLPRLPGTRRRMARNLDTVWPEMGDAERARLMRGASDHFARLCVEYAHLPRFARDVSLEVEGLEVLAAAKAAGKGAILVTAHYGNWEAARLAAKRAGFETGIIYRAFNNRYLDRYTMALIGLAGEPVMQKGPKGMRAMVAHVTRGGFVMVLVDQRTTGAPLIPFLGVPAETLTVAASLSRRTGAPVIPARARRADDRGRFAVRFEPAIAEDAPEAMMGEVNRRIGAWIAEDPDQWFWLHRRWRRVAQGGR
ncbi:MAG: hypothetical protein AAF074_14270 [Pseudomonadota bacterium]